MPDPLANPGTNFSPSVLDQDDISQDIPSAGTPGFLDDPQTIIDALAAEAAKNASTSDALHAIAAAAAVLKTFLPIPL